jgi:prepilin-type N-terminal cleavage/methylation domain-containing protein
MTRTRGRPSHDRAGELGLTLVEILVVVALISLIAAISLPSVGGYLKLSLNTAARELSSTIKEAYNSAVMTGKVHRLVYDLDAHEYWVESGPATALLDTPESKEREERRKRFAKPGEKDPKEGIFALEKGVTRKKKPLPGGVSFEDVLTEGSKEPFINGKAYTHFFPHGITEQTLIHLKDGQKHQSTLVISPLIGRTQVVDRYLQEREAYED